MTPPPTAKTANNAMRPKPMTRNIHHGIPFFGGVVCIDISTLTYTRTPSAAFPDHRFVFFAIGARGSHLPPRALVSFGCRLEYTADDGPSKVIRPLSNGVRFMGSILHASLLTGLTLLSGALPTTCLKR